MPILQKPVESPIMHKRVSVAEFKVLGDSDPKGTIEAIVSVFNNVDAAREVVMPGAFKDSLVRKLPKGVWGHDWTQPVAKTVEAFELLPGDPRLPISLMSLGGLYIKGQFNLETQRGKEAYSDIQFGIIDEFSIGYKVVKAHTITEEGEEVTDPFAFFFGTRYLDILELYEWSPVLVGMNDRTELIGVKEAPIGDVLGASLAAVFAVYEEAKALFDRRQKEGRTFSSANMTKLESFVSSLEEVAAGMRQLLDSAKSKPADDNTDLELRPTPIAEGSKLLAEFERLRFRLLTVKAGIN
jgi:HK97 family phage prohead protease